MNDCSIEYRWLRVPQHLRDISYEIIAYGPQWFHNG